MSKKLLMACAVFRFSSLYEMEEKPPDESKTDNCDFVGRIADCAAVVAARPIPRGQGVRIKVETGQEIDLYAESHALVIGISKYTGGRPELPGVKRAE